MADFNRVGNPQLASGIGRLYGVDFPQLGVVGSEIQITTSPWERPEFWALLGGSIAHGFTRLAAVAGIPSQTMLFNPVGSGVLLIVESVLFANGGGSTRFFSVNLKNDSAGFSSTGAWSNRDLRRATTTGGAGGCGCRILTNNATATTFNAAGPFLVLAAGQWALLPLDFVLPPGWGLCAVIGTPGFIVLNEQLDCGFFGRERPAPQTELGFL